MAQKRLRVCPSETSTSFSSLVAVATAATPLREPRGMSHHHHHDTEFNITPAPFNLSPPVFDKSCCAPVEANFFYPDFMNGNISMGNTPTRNIPDENEQFDKSMFDAAVCCNVDHDVRDAPGNLNVMGRSLGDDMDAAKKNTTRINSVTPNRRTPTGKNAASVATIKLAASRVNQNLLCLVIHIRS
jgi:hypothetical protein